MQDRRPGQTQLAGLKASKLDYLITALDTVQGDFPEVGDAVYALVSDNRLLERIAKFDSRAVPKLVDCMGRTEMARATAFGKSGVRVGVLCAEALIYTDFFQHRNSSDLLPAEFQDSADVDYHASSEELRRAQRHWRQYLARGNTR